MALPIAIDYLSDVPEELRQHYAPEGEKYVLMVDGEHPKVKEFRATNIALIKERDELLARFQGVDPDAARVERDENIRLAQRAEKLELQLRQLEAGSPRLNELEVQLATEKTARLAAEKSAESAMLKTAVANAFIKAGGRPEATDYILAQAAPLFSVQDGKVTSSLFSPTRPGERLTIEDFILAQTRTSNFAFAPSAGGGATGSRVSGTPGVREIRDPTPAELGRHASEIAAGTAKIVS